MDSYIEQALTNKSVVVGCAAFLSLFKTFYEDVDITHNKHFPLFMCIFAFSSLFIITEENKGLLVLIVILLATTLHKKIAL